MLRRLRGQNTVFGLYLSRFEERNILTERQALEADFGAQSVDVYGDENLYLDQVHPITNVHIGTFDLSKLENFAR